MKKFLIMILSVLIVASSAAFMAACDSCGGDVLSHYVLSQNGQLVEADFVLPKTIGDKEVSWSSNDETAIAVSKRDEDWLADVKLGDEVKNVTLTVKVGKEEKSFDVNVKALDVAYFADKFSLGFKSVTESFDLPTTYELEGKTATITWSVDREEDKPYISIDTTNNKCIVRGSTSNPTVILYGTFSYNNKTQKVPYKLTASLKMEHLEEVDYWYTNTGVSITMSGYIVAIATPYTTSNNYNNVTFYMVDDDFCAGYYIYRVKGDPDQGALLDVGVHVTVTGTTNTNYNGLIETNQGGNFVVDKDDNGNVIKISEADKAKLVYALDTDILAGAPNATRNTSRMVSLNKWAIKEIKSAPDAGVTATLFILEKGGVEVSVAVSKYLEGAYLTKAGDATWEGLKGLQSSLAVGDVVSVTGILGNYKGFQIMPLNKDAVVKESGAASAVPEAATKVKAALEAVNTALEATKGVITENKDFTVPKTVGDVAIEYKLVRESSSVTIGDGKISVVAGTVENSNVQVTFTSGEYKTVAFYNFRTKKLTQADLDKAAIEAELEKVKAAINIEATGDTVLPVSSNSNVTFAWAVKSGDAATLSADKLKLNVSTLPAEDKQVVLTLTATCGSQTSTKDVTFTVKAPVDMSGNYNVVLDLTSVEGLAKKYYFTGAMDAQKNYLCATTEDATAAAVVVVAKVEGGYTIAVNGKYLEMYKNGNYDNLRLNDSSTGVWVYDGTLKTFTWTMSQADGGKVYYLGTYTKTNNDGTKTTDTKISTSETFRISGDNAANVGKTQFVVSFVKASGETDSKVGIFALALQQTNLNKKLYLTGDMNGYYFATSESALEAAQVEVAKAEGGYTLKVVKNSKYIEIKKNGTHNNVLFEDTSSGVWTYDETNGIFIWTIGEEKFFLGTSKTYNTISANLIGTLAESFPAKFEAVTQDTRTDAQKADAALEKVAATLTVSKVGDVTLATSSVEGVTFAWAIKSGDAATLSADKLKLNVAALPSADATVVLTLTATCNDATKTKEVTVTVKAAVNLQQVTSSTVLKAGDKLVLTYGDYVIGAKSSNGNFRTAVSFDAANLANASIVTLEDAGNGKFYLKVSDGYLTAPTADSNYLLTNAEKATDGTSEWTITVDADGNATIMPTKASNNRQLLFNSNSGQERFSCYKSANTTNKNIVMYFAPESN